MNIRKKLNPKKCCANRCTKELFEQHIYPDGSKLWFCREHGHAGAVLAGQDRIEIKIENLTMAPEPEQAPVPVVQNLGEGEVLTPDLIAEIEKEKAQNEQDLAEVKDIVLEAPEEIAFAESELGRIRDSWKAWEEKRTSVTKPINKALRGINSWFKPVQEGLKALESAWDKSLKDARRRAQEQQQKLLQAAQETQEPAEIRKALVQASCVTEGSTATYIDRWDFEITDPTAIPREYLCPDLRKISATVAVQKEECAIPGVRVFNNPTIRPKR